MEKFTVSEVRDHAIWVGGVAGMGNSKTYTMLRAYADRLEADERVVPFGYAYRYWDGIRFDAGGREINGSKPTATIPLYTHPAPADAERLAEALREVLEALYVAGDRDDDGGRPNDVQEQIEHAVAAADDALTAHSAQAQPPAASVPSELAEPSTGVLNYEQELSFAEGWNACRKAMLAAQENPNG